MKAAETNLQSIFEGIKQYVVPLFQRPYSWEEKQWGKLWDDLVELSKFENPRSHFIGSIVTMPTTSVPEGVAKYLLIDGQQRLTTIFILLALLRDKLHESEEREELNNTLIVNQYKKGLDHYKLLPTQEDRYSFQNIIKEDKEDIDPSKQIIKAYNFFERKYRRSNIQASLLKKIISHHLSIVSIVLDADDNPYLVFESLNGTGLPLSQSDLIRNYFFMQIHTDDHEIMYESFWKPMEEMLGNNLTEFIRHYLMRSGSNVSQNNVYFSLKEKVSQKHAMEDLKELHQFAKYYNKISNPYEEPNLDVRIGLYRIKRLETTTVYPFLLNCYADYANGVLSATDFADVLSILENFLIRRFICNVPSDRLKSIFPALYSQVTTKGSQGFIYSLKTILQTKDYPKDSAFKKSLQESKLYGSRDRIKKTRIILERIEKWFNHKEQVSLDDSSISIEHVMPQTLTPLWQEHLGEDWVTTHELLLHTLGNLTITAYNSELSNDPFDIKKLRFKDSHFEINKYFETKNSWTAEDITERGAYLADIVLKIWSYFGDESLEVDDNVNVTGTTPKKLIILGQTFEVRSWRDVLEQTMNTISELEPERFEQLIVNFPRLIGWEQNKFRAIRVLKNGAYIEVNLSAQAIQRFCVQALETIELSSDDWNVETT